MGVEAGGAIRRELRAAIAEARLAGPGLRVLPLLLEAIARQDLNLFHEAEQSARAVRNVWAQISALIWTMALGPDNNTARRVTKLLLVSGLRRPVLVPSDVVHRATLGLVEAGIRSESVLDLAAASASAETVFHVARRFLDDSEVPTDLKRHALNAIAGAGALRSHDLLSNVAALDPDLADNPQHIVQPQPAAHRAVTRRR